MCSPVVPLSGLQFGIFPLIPTCRAIKVGSNFVFHPIPICSTCAVSRAPIWGFSGVWKDQIGARETDLRLDSPRLPLPGAEKAELEGKQLKMPNFETIFLAKPPTSTLIFVIFATSSLISFEIMKIDLNTLNWYNLARYIVVLLSYYQVIKLVWGRKDHSKPVSYGSWLVGTRKCIWWSVTGPFWTLLNWIFEVTILHLAQTPKTRGKHASYENQCVCVTTLYVGAVFSSE